MRKLTTFMLAFVTMFCISSKAQQITFDRIEKNETRHIGVGKMEIAIEGAKYDFSLTVFSKSDSRDYCLLISSFWKIEENCLVMLKLGNEDVVKLVANNINVGQVDYPTYSPIIGNSSASGVMSTQKVNYYVSLYSLEEDLLTKIAKNGIIKLRVAYGNSYFEKNWQKDRLGRFIKKCHEKLEKQLKETSIPKKSIESDF
jgi:hypothetical protein